MRRFETIVYAINLSSVVTSVRNNDRSGAVPSSRGLLQWAVGLRTSNVGYSYYSILYL